MATAEWNKVEEALSRLDRHRVLSATLAALRELARKLQEDAAFADVHPVVSVASLVLGINGSKRRVSIAWHEVGQYRVAFVDPPLEFSDFKMAREDQIVDVIRGHLDRVRRG